MYKRIIPVFLLRGGRLVKGERFGGFVDVGDPLSQAMIYDAQGAEEIAVLDINATSEKRKMDTGVITRMINRCRLPIAAGGGISSVADAVECFRAGADKVVVNTAAVLRPEIISELSSEFGAQSVVVSVDVRRDGDGRYAVYVNSGARKADVPLREHISRSVELGAGEILLTSIDREGTLSGFDLGLYEEASKYTRVPLIASGGAGCYDDIVELFGNAGCDACGLGKMLFLRDYDIVRIKSYLTGRRVGVRDA